MTIDDLRLRHSVRSYRPTPLTEAQARSLRAAVTDVNTHEPGMHFQLVEDDPEPFRGFSRSYGMIRGARHYIACVADTSYAHFLERAGYFGMELLMKACCLGLDTCFVGGTYSEKHISARVRVGEELLFLILVGEGTEKGTTIIGKLGKSFVNGHKRAPMDFLDTTLPWDEVQNLCPDIKHGLEAVSYAPSALGKQPVELRLAGGAITMSVPDKNPRQLIDLGIAMYSFQAVVPGVWEWGNPARFLPSSRL